jgi:ketosteroid isomerase-like protein
VTVDARQEQHVAVVLRIRDAFERAEYDEIVNDLHEECEFRNPEYAIEPGIRRGRPAFIRALQNVNQIIEFTIELEEVRPIGDLVVVGYRAVGAGRESGAPIDQHFGHVWTFQDGKVKSLEWFRSYDEALAAASA